MTHPRDIDDSSTLCLDDSRRKMTHPRDIDDSSTLCLADSRTLMGGTDFLRRGCREYHHQCSPLFGS